MAPASTSRWRLPFRLLLIGFLAIAAFFLVTEHMAHTVGVLPYLLLLACPLMHFLHHGHGGHGGHDTGGDLAVGRSAKGAPARLSRSSRLKT